LPQFNWVRDRKGWKGCDRKGCLVNESPSDCQTTSGYLSLVSRPGLKGKRNIGLVSFPICPQSGKEKSWTYWIKNNGLVQFQKMERCSKKERKEKRDGAPFPTSRRLAGGPEVDVNASIFRVLPG